MSTDITLLSTNCYGAAIQNITGSDGNTIAVIVVGGYNSGTANW